MSTPSDKRDRELGMGPEITRKDFINATLIGVGSVLLNAAAPAEALAQLARKARRPEPPPGQAQSSDPWTGYGGVGDYATSNGNTRPVIDAAHRVRDGSYRSLPASASDTGEVFDLVVVGGGLSGLAAAYWFRKATGDRMKCLVLENHPIFGGEAKGNEFLVNGVRLIAPQGSNNFGAPPAGSGSLSDELFTDLKIPREYKFQALDPSLRQIRIPMDNYANMDGHAEHKLDIGYFFPEGASGRWVNNIWDSKLEGTPFTPEVRQDLLKWRYATGYGTEAFRRYLDTMSYKDYIEKVMGMRPEVTRFIEPYSSLISGLSPDAVSAWAAHQVGQPGVTARARGTEASLGISFPGGNSEIARYLVKGLIPDSIEGSLEFEAVATGRINFASLDRAGSPTRIRLGATVVRVEHEGTGGSGQNVSIGYEHGGRVYRVKARSVVMASGGWINKHIIADLPADIRAAYDEFNHSTALIVNVALTNWRFMYKLGIGSARWFNDGFGFCCNLRRSMVFGKYDAPLHPDRPTVLTFYLGYGFPGHSAREQTVMARARLFSTMFADYERQIREQMVTLFGNSGFNPSQDIAGIVLNRWGHARQVQPPGWYWGRDGKAPAREIVARGYGRIAIGHSELNGHQSWTGAMGQGRRAMEQALKLL